MFSLLGAPVRPDSIDNLPKIEYDFICGDKHAGVYLPRPGGSGSRGLFVYASRWENTEFFHLRIDPCTGTCINTNHPIAATEIALQLIAFGIPQEIVYQIKWREDVFEPSVKIGEAEVENELCALLESRGIPFRRQVICSIGRVDVMTDEYVIEVESTFSGMKFYEAIGQAIAYNAALDGTRKPVIFAPRKVSAQQQRVLDEIGVLCWDFSDIPE